MQEMWSGKEYTRIDSLHNGECVQATLLKDKNSINKSDNKYKAISYLSGFKSIIFRSEISRE